MDCDKKTSVQKDIDLHNINTWYENKKKDEIIKQSVNNYFIFKNHPLGVPIILSIIYYRNIIWLRAIQFLSISLRKVK